MKIHFHSNLYAQWVLHNQNATPHASPLNLNFNRMQRYPSTILLSSVAPRTVNPFYTGTPKRVLLQNSEDSDEMKHGAIFLRVFTVFKSKKDLQ